MGEWHDSGFRVSNETHLWGTLCDLSRQSPGARPSRLAPVSSKLYVSALYLYHLRVLKALRSPMAIDLYCWLTYRNSYLRKPCRIPWAALAAQLGADYSEGKNFKNENPQRDPSGPRPVSQCPCRAGPWWNSLEALSSPR